MTEIANISKRNPVYDCAKGLGILFVVMGHCLAFGSQFYTKFHVLFFFVFAGLMLKADLILDIKKLWENIRKFFKRYGLPYIICNSAFILFHNLFAKFNLINFENYSLNTIFIKLIKTICLMSHSEQLCGAIWFLRSLFWGLTALAIIIFISHLIKINKYITYGIVSIVLIILTTINNNSALFYFSQSILCLIIGDILKNYISNFKLNFLWLIFPALIMIYLVPFVKNTAMSVILYGFLGFMFIYQISFLLNKYSAFIFNVVEYIGKNTLPILCLHFLCFKLVSYLYLLFTNSNISQLSSFPILYNQNYQWLLCILYLLSGIIIPLLLYQIYLKTKAIVIRRNAQ